MFNTKNADLKSVERTIKLLAGFHAVKIDDPQFLKTYRTLISLYLLLCKQKGKTPCLPLEI